MADKMPVSEKTRKVLLDHRQALQKQLDEIDARAKPARTRRDDAFARSQSIDEEIKSITEEINVIEADRFNVQNELAAVARSLGGLSTSQSTDADANPQ